MFDWLLSILDRRIIYLFIYLLTDECFPKPKTSMVNVLNFLIVQMVKFSESGVSYLTAINMFMNEL